MRLWKCQRDFWREGGEKGEHKLAERDWLVGSNGDKEGRFLFGEALPPVAQVPSPLPPFCVDCRSDDTLVATITATAVRSHGKYGKTNNNNRFSSYSQVGRLSETAFLQKKVGISFFFLCFTFLLHGTATCIEFKIRYKILKNCKLSIIDFTY